MQRIDHLLMVGLGGAAGASLRWSIGESIDVNGFPWHTLLVNIVGCALLAAITARERPIRLNRLLAAGFCGGLTTFSTFSVEVVDLLEKDKSGTAVAYVVASLAFGLVAFVGVRRTMITPPELGDIA